MSLRRPSPSSIIVPTERMRRDGCPTAETWERHRGQLEGGQTKGRAVIGRSRDPLDDPEELVRRVYAFVAYRLGDGPDAEDVTSETFARALRYRESYQREKGEPISWLIGIARHAIADHVARPIESSDD